MDWRALMTAGIQGLGLMPAQFWSLTPAELALMLGADACPDPLTRKRLAELESLYPDTDLKESR